MDPLLIVCRGCKILCRWLCLGTGDCKHESSLCATICWGLSRVSMITLHTLPFNHSFSIWSLFDQSQFSFTLLYFHPNLLLTPSLYHYSLTSITFFNSCIYYFAHFVKFMCIHCHINCAHCCHWNTFSKAYCTQTTKFTTLLHYIWMLLHINNFTINQIVLYFSLLYMSLVTVLSVMFQLLS